MMYAQPSSMCATASTSFPGSQRRPRFFLTQREFQQLHAARYPAEVTALPTSSGGIVAEKKPLSSKTCNDNQEVGVESEVETQISDTSEFPSSASAAAAVQVQNTGTSSESILTEVQRLRQENLVLRSENAELRGNPVQSPTPTGSPTQSGILAYGMSPQQTPMAALPLTPLTECGYVADHLAAPHLTPLTECGQLAYDSSISTECQQNLRFGGPLRYVVVASPMGMQTGQFEFGFDACDAQHVINYRTNY